MVSGTGSTAVTINLTNYREIYLIAKPTGAGTVSLCLIPKALLISTERIFYPSAPTPAYGTVFVTFRVSLTTARINGASVNGGDVTPTTPFEVYAR